MINSYVFFCHTHPARANRLVLSLIFKPPPPHPPTKLIIYQTLIYTKYGIVVGHHFRSLGGGVFFMKKTKNKRTMPLFFVFCDFTVSD